MKQHSRQIRTALSAALTITVGALSLSTTVAADPKKDAGLQHQPATGLVRVVQQSTAPFLKVSNAEAAGYMIAGGCTSDGGNEGAMGLHYANFSLLGDGALDEARPEILVYEPMRNGKMRLVAVEYLVFVDAWGAANPPPVLRGQQFHYLGSPNRYGLPAAYILHVWAWKSNPNGAYSNFNPRVSCESYDAP